MTVEGSASNATVVYLLNFLAPDVIAITQAWNQKVGKLIVLISVSMEGNRSWVPDDGGLNVREQRTWTRTRIDRHPGGYEDVNYVHFPLDTMSQLRRAQPEVVVSAELGMRSMLSAVHCGLSGWFGLRPRRCKLVLAVSTSPWIESSRSGWLRRTQRRWLLRCADRVTYHGPECQQWLLDFGVPADRLAPFQYAADPTKIYRDELQAHASDQVRVVTVGQLIDRKGVREGLRQMIEVASSNPTLRLQWTLVGGGPLLDEIQSAATPANLTVRCLGNCTTEQIRDAYRDHEVMFFPTRGDEWGLVVDEALHSGLVVIGNPRAQAVSTLVKDGVNGWVCPIDDTASLGSALTTFSAMSGDERMMMREQARSSVSDRTPEHAADQITAVIDQLIEHQSGDSSRH